MDLEVGIVRNEMQIYQPMNGGKVRTNALLPGLVLGGCHSDAM